MEGLGNVVIKFTERYSAEVHKIVANMNYAPKLYYYGVISRRYKVVVMEHIATDVNITTYFYSEPEKKQTIIGQCESVLSTLHTNNFCHGDFRAPNILVHNDTIRVLDFDWSGQVGSIRYPLFMNKGWQASRVAKLELDFLYQKSR